MHGMSVRLYINIINVISDKTKKSAKNFRFRMRNMHCLLIIEQIVVSTAL